MDVSRSPLRSTTHPKRASMRFQMTRLATYPKGGRGLAGLILPAALFALAFSTTAGELQAQAMPSTEPRMTWDPNDPRIGLGSGWLDAEEASWNLELITNLERPDGFRNPETPGDGRFNNTDLAFQGDRLFQGNYNGFQVFDISQSGRPDARSRRWSAPVARETSPSTATCSSCRRRRPAAASTAVSRASRRPSAPSGCAACASSTSPISRIRGRWQPCSPAGARTRTPWSSDPNDPDNIYIYIQGTGGVRPADELAGCSAGDPEEDQNTALFRIEVVRVPLANPGAGRDREHAPHLRRRRDRRHRRPLAGWRPRPRHAGAAAARPSATTSPRSRPSGSRRAPARATASCSTSRIRCNPMRVGRGVGPELRLLALGDVQQRRHQGRLHRRVGRRLRAALPRDRSRPRGAPTRSSGRARTAR